MIIEFGHFAVIVALVLSVVGMAAPLYGLKFKREAWSAVGRQAVMANFFLITIGMAAMIFSYVTEDYSVKYVFSTSNSRLPLFYKVAGLWGGHEGSLLLWTWVLSLFGALVVSIHWKTQPGVMPYFVAINSFILHGFLLLILFLSNPFERIFPIPPDGRDLNPLLQDPAMVIHPPMLYLGYVGLSVPYSFAMAALLSGRLGEEWVKTTQRWTLIAWLALTTGILMGGYWAYYELGWGGYWGWDPVENASFMPWLVATAFLHSVMVQEARKMFKVWNLFLIIVAFSLSLIGTFLVRSGILSSVHSFATDPGRGLFILAFLSVVLLFSFGTLILRGPALKSKIELNAIISRESAFLFNNLFFLVAMVTIFVGTLYPLFMEVLKFKKVSVGPPYYNAVFMPIALGLIFLMGVGPYIPWRKASWDGVKKTFFWPAVIAPGGVILAFIVGIREGYALSGLGVVLFVVVAIFSDLSKLTLFWAHRNQVNYFRGFIAGFRANPRRLAGILTHVGVLVMVVGIICSTLYQTEKMLIMKPGDTLRLDSYRVKLDRLYPVEGVNWSGQEALFQVLRDGETITELRPQKRIYSVSQTPTTETAIYQIHTGHIFLTIPEVAPDGSWARVRALHNPLVLWVWYGGGIMGLGVILNVFRRRRLPVAATGLVEAGVNPSGASVEGAL